MHADQHINFENLKTSTILYIEKGVSRLLTKLYTSQFYITDLDVDSGPSQVIMTSLLRLDYRCFPVKLLQQCSWMSILLFRVSEEPASNIVKGGGPHTFFVLWTKKQYPENMTIKLTRRVRGLLAHQQKANSYSHTLDRCCAC